MAPTHAELRHLRAGGAWPLVHALASPVCCVAGLWLALRGNPLSYAAGQAVLALTFVHAFVLLHEAGHSTLFRSRRANLLIGHWAGCLSLIPFASWRPIHARHHKYTGWQDLDATTATLVPRRLARWERFAIDAAWRTGAPLFSILYRLQNYWHVPRIHSFLRDGKARRRIAANALALLVLYGTLCWTTGIGTLAMAIGPALFLALAIEDVLLLSQHTHIPQQLSGGHAVDTFHPREQARFTRSLRLPAWLSLVLMHFDAHELHHMYPEVPGYRLRAIDYRPPNEVAWLGWLRAAKRLTGADFLFRNRDDTGASV